ncbi:hypothetical protein RAZWK3B_14579 [Roseobacter sp. AzwK-3b]|nr:hypothetical protein RAZWK3B_14579 [Roseobacter sp. AzwK-3b]
MVGEIERSALYREPVPDNARLKLARNNTPDATDSGFGATIEVAQRMIDNLDCKVSP